MYKTIFTDFRTTSFIILILTITVIIFLIFRYSAEKHLQKLTSSKHIDYMSFMFAKKIIYAIIISVGISLALAQIPEMRIVGHSMLAGAGIISFVLGMASKQALSNIISGFLIVIFKPFKINHRITINKAYTGIVEEITLRHIIVRDFDNNRVIIPNSVVSKEIIVNTDMTESKVCKKIEVGISYNSDIEKALKIMENEVIKHPLHIDNRSAEDVQNNVPEVISRVVALGDSSVSLKVWAYAENASKASVLYFDLLQSIKHRFDEENIEIPYAYQNIIIKKETI